MEYVVNRDEFAAATIPFTKKYFDKKQAEKKRANNAETSRNCE